MLLNCSKGTVKIPVMCFITSLADYGAQVKDIHIAQVETLIKRNKGKHEEDCDETSLLTSIHGPAILTCRTS